MSGVGPPQRTFAPAPRSRDGVERLVVAGPDLQEHARVHALRRARALEPRLDDVDLARQRRQLVDVDDHAERRVEARRAARRAARPARGSG